MDKRLRNQSAMEYLMTYGWAILAIAIVMVSLYSLGIFNTGNLQPTATPGSCEVVRTSAQTSLAGQCSNLIPKYVGQFAGSTGSYINVGNIADLHLVNNLTIFAWVYSSPTNQQGGLVCKPYYGEYCLLFNLNQFSCSFYQNNGGSAWASYANYNCTMSAKSWYSIAATRTVSGGTSTITFYMNGRYAGQGTISSAPASSTEPLYIGFAPSISTYNGSIADVQIYNTSLDSATIKSLYQEGIGGAPIDIQYLIGWWPLNGNANDYSGNSNQGTPTQVTWNANWQSGYTAPTT